MLCHYKCTSIIGQLACPRSQFLGHITFFIIIIITKVILVFVDNQRPDRVKFPKTIKCNAIFLRFCSCRGSGLYTYINYHVEPVRQPSLGRPEMYTQNVKNSWLWNVNIELPIYPVNLIFLNRTNEHTLWLLELLSEPKTQPNWLFLRVGSIQIKLG